MGTATYQDNGSFETGEGALLEVGGSFTLASDASWNAAYGPADARVHILPGGTFDKTGGADSNVELEFDNDGATNSSSGRLALRRGDGTASSAGSFGGSGGAVVTFAGGSFDLDGGSSITGRVEIADTGTVSVNAATTATPASNLLLAGNGTLQGAGTLSVQGSSSWTGGTMTGAGTTTVAPGATLTLSGAGVKTLSGGRALDNEGTVTWTDTGGISHGGGATLTTAGGALFEITGDAAASFDQGGAPLLVHTLPGGTLRKSAGTGTSTLDADLDNEGTLAAQSGTLVVSGSATNTATGAYSLESGGNLTVAGPFTNAGLLSAGPGSTFAVANGSFTNAGTLRGTGTIDANVTSSGTVAPGLSPGLLTIDGDYTQTPAGRLRTELAGTTPGSEHDQLVVTGAATLGGTLVIETATGYSPLTGDEFEIETGAGTRSGQFTTVEGRYLPDGRLYTVVYGASSVRLVVSPRTRPYRPRPASR